MEAEISSEDLGEILHLHKRDLEENLESIAEASKATIQQDRRAALQSAIDRIDLILIDLDQHNIRLAREGRENVAPFTLPQEILPLLGYNDTQTENQTWLTCVACTESRPRSEALVLQCEENHIYCNPCIIQLFDKATSTDVDLFPPRCCGQQIPLDTVRRIIGGELAEKTALKLIEVRTQDRTYCSNAECSTFIQPDTIVAGAALASCPVCETLTCALCKRGWHPGEACGLNEDAQEVHQIAAQEGWRQCPACSEMIELSMGCNHMTCRCGTQFCYVCGARWRTCTCPQWHEGRLYQRAEHIVNRRVRRDRAPVEAGRDMPLDLPNPFDERDMLADLFRADIAPEPVARRPAPEPFHIEPTLPHRWRLGQREPSPTANLLEFEAMYPPPPRPTMRRRRRQRPTLAQRFDFALAEEDLREPLPSPQQEVPNVRAVAEWLRDHHDCVHSLRWRGVEPLNGSQQCELCYRYTSRRMKECRRCALLVCESCRRNRIRDQRTT